MTTPTSEHDMSGTQKVIGKYLTFKLDGQSYGIRALVVREIIRLTKINFVPRLPAYMRGVINLRGKIIPIMDLRLKFGLPGAQNSDQTCIIVVQVKFATGKSTQMGLVVDGVEEVVNLAESDIEDTPNFGTRITTDCILGMAKIKGVVNTLLDIDRIAGTESLENLKPSPAVS